MREKDVFPLGKNLPCIISLERERGETCGCVCYKKLPSLHNNAICVLCPKHSTGKQESACVREREGQARTRDMAPMHHSIFVCPFLGVCFATRVQFCCLLPNHLLLSPYPKQIYLQLCFVGYSFLAALFPDVQDSQEH
jgi:hypothetical protein